MNKKMKLLHVTSSLKIGGAEAVLCNIIKKLGSSVFEHHVIYFHEGPNVAQIKSLGVSTYKVKGLLSLYDPVFFARLFFLIKKLQPNLIHSLLWSANVSARLIAKLLKIPNVSAYHLDIYNDGTFRNTIDRMTRNMSDLVIAVSDDVAKSLGNSKSYKRLEVIKNGIDFADIHQKGINAGISKKTVGILEENIVIGSVGRLHPQKNYPLLLQSFSLVHKNFPQTRLVIVGIGPQEEMLKKLAKELGLQNKVVFVVGKQAYGYFPIFDIFVQSSNKEGLSIALLEAMSFGLPCVVTSPDGSHPVICNKKNGIITTVKDAHKLANAINFLLKDRIFAKNIGDFGKKNVEQDFSDISMVNSYKTIFTSLPNRKL